MTSQISFPPGCNLLAIDTSGLEGSLALAHSNQLHERKWLKKAMHSEIITVELEALLLTAHCPLEELTHLCVNVGPGSFTGLRIGISLAKTLAYSLNLKVLPLNRLACLASREGRDGEIIFVACKAVQNYYYCASFLKKGNRIQSLQTPMSMAGDDLLKSSQSATKVLIEGQTRGFDPQTEAKDLIASFAEAIGTDRFLEWSHVEPLYIRGSEAEEKLRKGLLKPI